MDQPLGQRAVVIGGSVAGLMTARVLTDHFESVTVLDRDAIEHRPTLHRSIPQGHHYHALLLGGQQVLSSLFDGFADELHALGAVRFRLGKEIAFILPGGKAYTMSGAVKEPRDLGFDAHSQSRGLIEHCVRQRALAVPAVELQTGCTVQGLVHRSGRVSGVRYEGPAGPVTVAADLVVDTGGRGSHAPRWLEELGVARPPETTIGIDFAYASTKYRLRSDHDIRERLLGFFGPAPKFPNGAYLGAIEDDTWHVSLAGRFGDYPPTDEAGFLAYARSLHTPVLHDYIKDAERVADIVGYRFPTSVQRHYEQLPSFPRGFVVLGDAICSFNPIYGQGMSSAALQVETLQRLLRERAAGSGDLDGLAAAFFPRAAQVIATPWTLAASLDLAYPQTVGDRSGMSPERARYFAALNALAAVDVEVQKLMTEVFHLARPLSALWTSRCGAECWRRPVERAGSPGYARPVSALTPLIVAVTVALLAAPAASAQARSSDVSQKASETIDAIKSYSVEKKDEAVAYARKVGADVDARIKELKAQAARQTGEAKAKSDTLIKDLEAKRAQAGRKAREMSHATKASWDKTKNAFAEAYREVAAAYDRAAAEIRK